MSIFESFDDYMFPTTAMGKRAMGIFEPEIKEGIESEPHIAVVMESVESTARAQAMSAVLDWVDMGEHTYGAMEELITAIADLDGDEDITEDEEAYYNDIWQQIPDAMLSYGCDINDVQAFVDGPGTEADAAAARLGTYLQNEMGQVRADNEHLITGFAYGEDAVIESASDPEDANILGVLEATYKRRKVVRDGKVVVKLKRVSGKVRLSAAQKAALKKARRRANTAAAKISRRKSMRIRKSRGM